LADTWPSVTPLPAPGSSGKTPMMLVAVPERGLDIGADRRRGSLAGARSWFQAARFGSWSSTLATGAFDVLM
jgi:hypothetical protein